MAKGSGLGQRLYLGGYASQYAVDLSGDIGSIENCHGGPELLTVTGINKSAVERIGGRRDGGLDWTAYFNPAVGAEHDYFSTLPTGDILALYCCGTTVGDPVAALYGRTPTYNGKRANNGALTFTVGMQGDGFGLEWCQLYKAQGTDASAATGTAIDGAADTSFGASAYALVFSLGSGTMTPEFQDSADNVTFAAVTGMTFAGVAAASGAAQRVQSATGQSIRRYTRFASTGTFTNASWAAAAVRHQTSTL